MRRCPQTGCATAFDVLGNVHVAPRPAFRRQYSGLHTWSSHGFANFTVALMALTGDPAALFESAYFTACKMSLLGASADDIRSTFPSLNRCFTGTSEIAWHDHNRGDFLGNGVQGIVDSPECAARPGLSPREAICVAKTVLDARYVATQPAKRAWFEEGNYVEGSEVEDPSDAIYRYWPKSDVMLPVL